MASAPSFDEPFEPPFDADVVVDTFLAAGKWFARPPGVPPHWFPRDDLEPTSFAFGVLFAGRSDDSAPRKVGADAWFDRPCATRFMVRDQVVRYLTELPAGSDDLSAL